MSGADARQAALRLRAAGLGDLLAEARRRIEANDGLRGSVAVDAGAAYAAALADLVGWRRLRHGERGRIRLPLADLDAALRASAFAVGLLDVLAADAGPVVTRRVRRDRALEAWQAQLRRIAAAMPADARAARPAAALEGDGPCGRWYRRAYREDPAAAERHALAAGRALAALPPGGRGVLLAVFAAAVAGDPHALDRGRPAGALLQAALREQAGEPPADMRPAEAWAYLLARSGLDVDDVSSTVLAAHLAGSAHPVVASMAAAGGGWPLPLGALRDLRLAPRPGRPAFVVENPQVFAHLVRGAPADSAPLVCTSGFLSAAALRLLDALDGAGYALRYGGDFDRNGLAIAGGLARRYARLRPWRMAPRDYAEAAAGLAAPVLPDADRAWLLGVEGPLGETARAIAAAGAPAYQERLVERLLEDVRAAG